MPKRFTNTEKWKDRWFCELESKYRIAWFYLLDNCDHAGIWPVHISLMNFLTKYEYETNELLEVFVGRIEALNEEYWYISKFVKFQYGTLKEESKPHKSVINRLKEFGIWERVSKGYEYPLDTVKDKEKVKSKNQVKEKEIASKFKNKFDLARNLFPGTKRGLDTEFNNFTKRHKKDKEIIPLLVSAIENQIQWRKNAAWSPNWKNFETWINNKHWEDERPDWAINDSSNGELLTYNEALIIDPSLKSFTSIKTDDGVVKWRRNNSNN